MKNIITGLLAGMLLFAFYGCDNNEHADEPKEPGQLPLNIGTADLVGEYEEPASRRYTLVLTDIMNYGTNPGQNPGYLFSLDLYTPVYENPDGIKNGTYAVSDTPQRQAIVASSSSYYINKNNARKPVTGGQLTVYREVDTYHIEGTLVVDGGTIIGVTYSGEIEFTE